MPYRLLVGGARSGKTRLAERIASRSGARVTFIATATAGDEEMRAKISEHRSLRPDEWDTVEEPHDPAGVVRRLEPDVFAVLDCLTLWVSNLMAEVDDETVLGAARSLADVLAVRHGDAVVVTNEVGSGIVPAHASGRRFRDLLGGVNGIAAASARDAYLVVAGRAIRLDEVDIDA